MLAVRSTLLSGHPHPVTMAVTELYTDGSVRGHRVGAAVVGVGPDGHIPHLFLLPNGLDICTADAWPWLGRCIGLLQTQTFRISGVTVTQLGTL